MEAGEDLGIRQVNALHLPEFHPNASAFNILSIKRQ